MNKIVYLALICLQLTSCSVIMASRKSGTSITTVQSAKTRGQFLALGPQVISSERLENGDIVDVYQYQQEKGSLVRALMHGVLDLSTGFLWEFIGTPIEGFQQQSGFFVIRVTYNGDEVAKGIEIL